MRRSVSALKARGNLGQILEGVYYRGDEYIIERAGRPMAAVVPVEQYEQWRREREEFFTLVDEVRERNRNIPAQEVARDVAAAVRAARKRR
ncbi:MAG: type II toxin-antitoxin system prevent-host-death family antitoxin [Armatimonadota bacterium]|jgi:prevent-host-death family protein